jgi:capsular polysaccharide biosynthesis protein
VRDYLLLLRDGWIAILCATALSAAAGWISWQTTGPVYQSSTKMLAITPGGASTPDAYFGQLNAVARADTYQLLARGSWVTTRTIEQLGLSETPEELAARIAVPQTATAVLDLVVTGDDAERTRETADAVTANLIQLSKEMSAVDTAGSELVLVDEASPAIRQGSVWRSIRTRAALGLPLSMVLVIASGLLGDRLLGRGQVGRVVGETAAEGNR